MSKLLDDEALVPGLRGAYLTDRTIFFKDMARLTSMRRDEFLLTREVITEVTRQGKKITRRYKIYSGTPDHVFPPIYKRVSGNTTIVERQIGHTHPRPIPYDPKYKQPSGNDIEILNTQPENPRPFSRIIWGIGPDDHPTIYGPKSTEGNAVLPEWMIRKN